jgi:CRISPR-associated endonuclease Csn1
MKKILGLDLGTNSIGWALIKKGENDGEIINAGSRIIPMPQDMLGKFDAGASISQTAERTGFRGTRRLRERHLLRRERLHRVLNILNFLPEHYAENIDFEKRLGQFIPESEPKIAYNFNQSGNKADFLFKKSFAEMVADFTSHQPELLSNGKKIPYDWTIYYLRKKALTQKLENEELSWLLLHFNHKRGYYQLRGEDDEEKKDQLVEFYSLKVVDVIDSGEKKGTDGVWYNVQLENGWIYRRTSKTPLDWIGKIKDFIVTTDLSEDGTVKKNKEGKEKRSFRAPAENDWTLVKKKTEQEIDKTNKTVGEFIYDTLLQNPKQKINGKLVRTIEREFYKDELKKILEKQQELNPGLQNKDIYNRCIEELYEYNEPHRKSIIEKDFVHLFLNDIIFYQRPLKSKKSLISNCRFESKVFIKEGKKETEPLKCIAKSHPLFQEFRLWKFIQSLRIYEREKEIEGRLYTDIDVTSDFLGSTDKIVELFDWLNDRKDIEQKQLLTWLLKPQKKKTDNYRWNYVEDKTYPCNETRAFMLTRLSKVPDASEMFLSNENTEALWHILYSVTDKVDIEKALTTFSKKHNLNPKFIDAFKKFPPFKNEYGSYSVKAIKKILPLMRMGKYWSAADIQQQIKERIEKIITGEWDEKIKDRVREKTNKLDSINDFQGLPEWLATYTVYNRHSEAAENNKWGKAYEIKLLEQHSLRNPVVEQVINETLQVVKDIWKKYGNADENFFDEIHIELGREMKNTKADREKISKQNSENENTNLRIKALLAEMINDSSFENVRPYSPMQQEILKLYEEGVLNAEDGKIPEDILKISKQAQPSSSDLTRYKLWLQQKYRSPYTGEIIPLNKLFTPAYEIEHIIPQSRYFDDSFNNKVICEAVVNSLKDNQTGYEFINNFKGSTVPELSTTNKTVKIFTVENYERFVKENYSKSRGKMKRLLMEDIPEAFIQRQLNDSRYISKMVKNLLSNIVRGDDEQEMVSKNVISSSGAITSILKQDWGLNDVWNEIITPRFERLNTMTSSSNFGEWTNKDGKKIFQTQVPLELQKGFSKKRIDHRHHALDAIVIACATRDHINYLNNENALGKKTREEKEKKRYDLRHKLCIKKYNDASNTNYKWLFRKPWETFTQESKGLLNNIVVSFKQNLRIINKTINRHYKWVKQEDGTFTKELVKQIAGDSWAVRKPIHTPMPYGKKQYNFDILKISDNINKREFIIADEVRIQLDEIVNKNNNKVKDIKDFLKSNPIKDKNGNPIIITAFKIKTEKFRKRAPLSELSNRGQGGIKTYEDAIKFIDKVADLNLRKELLTHLEENQNNIDLAFNPDGLDNFNAKRKIAVYKLPIAEGGSGRFALGETIGTKHKYVEAAKGTNLFFAIYIDDKGKRNYETVPLNIAIERLKQGLTAVPEKNETGDSLLMQLSPQDLVYVPTEEEIKYGSNLDTPSSLEKNNGRIYKIVSFTGNRLSAIPYYVATSIVDKVEYTQINKLETTLDKISIKEFCIKLKCDRLGNIKPAL